MGAEVAVAAERQAAAQPNRRLVMNPLFIWLTVTGIFWT